MDDSRLSARVASAMFAVDAGFGIAMPFALAHLARTGELPMTPWGFRAFSGPFESLGRGRFVLLGWTLVGVSVLDSLAAVWLWQGRRRGARLGLATTPFALFLGGGFALPFLLVPAALRPGLVLAIRRHLR